MRKGRRRRWGHARCLVVADHRRSRWGADKRTVHHGGADDDGRTHHDRGTDDDGRTHHHCTDHHGGADDDCRADHDHTSDHHGSSERAAGAAAASGDVNRADARGQPDRVGREARGELLEHCPASG
jgi:hypothetical protein